MRILNKIIAKVHRKLFRSSFSVPWHHERRTHYVLHSNMYGNKPLIDTYAGSEHSDKNVPGSQDQCARTKLNVCSDLRSLRCL